MTDVCTKAITGNDITNGRIVVGVTPGGDYSNNGNPISGVPFLDQNELSASGLFTRYGSRFDDTTYYG